MNKKIFFTLIFLVYLIWHFIYLDKFLKVGIDDAWDCEPAWHFLKTGIFAMPSFKGIYGLEHYENRFGRIFIFAQLPFLAIFGPQPISIRISALLSGLLLLWMTYILGKYIYNEKIASLGTLLLAISGMFTVATHYGRPDTMLAFFVILALYTYLRAKEKNSLILFFLSGLVSTISLDVHLNGIMLFLTLGLLFLVEYRLKVLKSKNFWIWVTGALLGCLWWICLHILPNPKLFFDQWSGVVLGFFGSPILRTKNILELLSKEIDRYSTWYWGTTAHRNMFELIVIISALVFVIFKKNKTVAEKNIIFVIFSFLILFMFIVSSRTSWYLIYLYPFFMLSIVDMSLNWRILKGLNMRFLIPLMVIFYLSNIFAWSIKYRDADFKAYMESIKKYVPEKTLVIGSMELWHGFVEYAKEFSSIHNYGAYETVYKMSFPEYVNYWKSDYIILDKEGTIHQQNLSFFMNSTELVGKVETKFYGERSVTGKMYEILIYKVKK